jgi:hypothetical protein
MGTAHVMAPDPARAPIDPAATDRGTDAPDGARDRRPGRTAVTGDERSGLDDPSHDDACDADAPDDDPSEREPRWREARWAIASSLVVAGSVVGAAVLIGQVSAFEARRLFEGIKPTATFAASTYIGAGTTVLALMATMIGFSISHESRFRASHYRRLRMVAVATTALIVVAIAMLSCLIVPIAEADASSSGYIVLYWGIVGLGAVGAGLTIAIVLMLNDTVRGLIDLGRLGRSHLTKPSDD